jgi:hypothetical protein
MRLMFIAIVMTSLTACSWNDGPFGYRQPDGNLGIGADHGDDHHEEALRLQNDEAVRRTTPLTSQQSR